jgi:rhodanese-related sulfurtransferase
MDTRCFASVVLGLAFLCSCSPSGGAGHSATESGLSTKDPLAQIKEIRTGELQQWMSAGQQFTLIDVRQDNEWQAGHAAAAIHVSRWELPRSIETIVPDKTVRVVLYCGSGVRSAAAAVGLQRMGYTQVYSLAGGFNGYRLAGLPVEK